MSFAAKMVIHYLLRDRDNMCKYILTYNTNPIEYFNNNTEIEYFLIAHNIKYRYAFADSYQRGPILYYEFLNNKYRIIPINKGKKIL